MNGECWIERVKLASSSRDEGQLHTKQTVHCNAGHEMTTTQHQPAGVQLLEHIAVQPWTQLKWECDAACDCLATIALQDLLS